MPDASDNDFLMAMETAISTPTASTPSPRIEPAAIAPQLALPCMWGDCGIFFTSLSDLAEHVNLVHLVHLCQPPPPSPPTTSAPPELSSMSCQWKDCNVYPTPDLVPGPSSGDIDSMLCVLSSHLFHDHLGLDDIPPCLHAHAALHPEPAQAPFAPSEPGPSTLPPENASPAGHVVCQWTSCGQSFSSLDELTQHLTDVHVGSGKTCYDCYWQDCARHGENGFTSKQKLSRHLQVRRYSLG
jgi:hypothetical protein